MGAAGTRPNEPRAFRSWTKPLHSGPYERDRADGPGSRHVTGLLIVSKVCAGVPNGRAPRTSPTIEREPEARSNRGSSVMGRSQPTLEVLRNLPSRSQPLPRAINVTQHPPEPRTRTLTVAPVSKTYILPHGAPPRTRSTRSLEVKCQIGAEVFGSSPDRLHTSHLSDDLHRKAGSRRVSVIERPARVSRRSR